jgi:hypothetical protein
LRALLVKADRRVLTYAGAVFIGLRGDAWHELRERLHQIASRTRLWLDYAAGAKYLRHAVVRTLE